MPIQTETFACPAPYQYKKSIEFKVDDKTGAVTDIVMLEGNCYFDGGFIPAKLKKSVPTELKSIRAHVGGIKLMLKAKYNLAEVTFNFSK